MVTIQKWFSAGVVLVAFTLVPRAHAIPFQRFDDATLPGYSDEQMASGVCWQPLPPEPEPSRQSGETAIPTEALPAQPGLDTGEDRLAGFSRRPFDNFTIPAGGRFLDPRRDGVHYGIDYANPDNYLDNTPTYFYPIGPGYVTARSFCIRCYIDSDQQGRVDSRAAEYNFGWGGLVLIETPYSADISIYVLYAHLRGIFVNPGDYVTPDQVIGVVGTTGYSEELHLHLEVRYGAPGRFWKADFSQQEILDRWLSTMFANPAMLIFPENHWAFALELDEWAAQQVQPCDIP